MFVGQEKQFCFAFKLMIPKSIGKIPMVPPSFIKFFVGTKIKAQPQAFPGIGRNPIIPGTQLKIADIQVTGRNKIELPCKLLKGGSCQQCIDHFYDTGL
jgi:hypothetical protein